MGEDIVILLKGIVTANKGLISIWTEHSFPARHAFCVGLHFEMLFLTMQSLRSLVVLGIQFDTGHPVDLVSVFVAMNS